MVALTDPNNPDSDEDGWIDGEDPFPLFWLPLWSVLALVGGLSAGGLLGLGIFRTLVFKRISWRSRKYEQLAQDLAKITHGYLSVSDFHRSLLVLSKDDESPPDEIEAESYLQVYGFKKVKDKSILDEHPNDGLYFHPKILAKYTFDSLP